MQIGSEEENEFILKSFLKGQSHFIWLGALKDNRTDTFKWLDGKEMKYSNWATNRFLMVKKDEPCIGVVLYVGKDWYGNVCSHPRTVVCEKAHQDLNEFKKQLSSQITDMSARLKQLEDKVKTMAKETNGSPNPNRQFNDRINDMAAEIEFQKQRSDDFANGQKAERQRDLDVQVKQNQYFESRLKQIELRSSNSKR